MATRDINTVILSGTAFSAPTMISLKNNVKLCIFTLRTVEKFVRGSGETAQHDNFLVVETLGKTAERCMQDVKTGGRYFINGYLRVDDLHGVERVRIRAVRIEEE